MSNEAESSAKIPPKGKCVPLGAFCSQRLRAGLTFGAPTALLFGAEVEFRRENRMLIAGRKFLAEPEESI
jgi:hypothetical protein